MTIGKALYLWAKGDEFRAEQLRDWRDEALLSIAAGKGKELQSSSANGMSMTFATGSTVLQWFEALSTAISLIEKPPVSAIYGRLI